MSGEPLTWYWVSSSVALRGRSGRSRASVVAATLRAKSRFFWKTASTLPSSSGNVNPEPPVQKLPPAAVSHSSSSGVQDIDLYLLYAWSVVSPLVMYRSDERWEMYGSTAASPSVPVIALNHGSSSA